MSNDDNIAIPRTGEDGETPDRKSRFFQHGDQWFFSTRECSIIGPYESLNDAHEGCGKFIHQVQEINDYHKEE